MPLDIIVESLTRTTGSGAGGRLSRESPGARPSGTAGGRGQNIVEKLARAFRPGEGKRVRSCFAARNFKGRETSGAQIHVEYANKWRVAPLDTAAF